jgi:hypothetical protein
MSSIGQTWWFSIRNGLVSWFQWVPQFLTPIERWLMIDVLITGSWDKSIKVWDPYVPFPSHVPILISDPPRPLWNQPTQCQKESTTSPTLLLPRHYSFQCPIDMSMFTLYRNWVQVGIIANHRVQGRALWSSWRGVWLVWLMERVRPSPCRQTQGESTELTSRMGIWINRRQDSSWILWPITRSSICEIRIQSPQTSSRWCRSGIPNQRSSLSPSVSRPLIFSSFHVSIIRTRMSANDQPQHILLRRFRRPRIPLGSLDKETNEAIP